MAITEPPKRGTPARWLKRTVDLHMGSAWEDVKDRHRHLNGLVREISDTPARRPSTEASPVRSWADAVRRYRYAVPRLRRNYSHWALQARGFAIGMLLSLLFALHRLWLADWGGLLASLACVILCAVLALVPAYRSWQIRTRTLSPLHDFLRQPQHWWPERLHLPPDYTLLPESSQPSVRLGETPIKPPPA